MSSVSGYTWEEIPFKEKGRPTCHFPITVTVTMQVAMGPSEAGGWGGVGGWREKATVLEKPLLNGAETGKIKSIQRLLEIRLRRASVSVALEEHPGP